MAGTVYLLGTLVTLLCAVLLSRAYAKTKTPLLIWSGLCFAALTVSNGLVFVDLVVFPELNLYAARLGTAAVGMLLLVYGLMFESK